MKMDSLVCKNCERSGLAKTTSVGLQEFVDTIACYGHLSEAKVHGVYKKNDLQRGLPPADSLERNDGLRHSIIQNGEILLLKTAYGRVRLWSNYNVQMNLAIARKGWRMILPS